MTKPTVIDLFCGAGGFSEGFRQQGFEIVYGVDCWKPAVDTFNHNFGLSCVPSNILDFETSIELINQLPDTDIIIGSPPCEDFSSSNKSGKADKSLGLKLIKIFLKIVTIKKHQPDSKLKAWIMENVRNSTAHLEDKYTFKQLDLSEWALEKGFNPDMDAICLKENRASINSANFGVPQSRVRAFVGEITQTQRRINPAKTHKAPDKEGNLPNYITLGYIRESLPKPNSEKAETLIADPLYPGIKVKQIELTDHFYDTGLYACEWKESRYLKQNHPYMGHMAFPEREDRPSRTVTATKIGTSREAIILPSTWSRKGDGEYRTATVREAATLMGFPITFQFLASEGNKWKLVGNAVCPPVSRAFAKEIREQYGLEEIVEPVVTGLARLNEVQDLNTFKSKQFNNSPRRKKGSRFRRHPFKDGNMTVTLSNYDIEENTQSQGKWQTSIQYGTGEGFIIQKFTDGYFKNLEPIISEFEGGTGFIDVISNGFSEKIPSALLLQQMYEDRRSEGRYIGPEQLIEAIRDIIEKVDMKETTFNREPSLFKKNSIPKKQVMALYAISKICSIANGERNDE